jgi:segregation and condensation protein B
VSAMVDKKRLLEATLFAASEPLGEAELQARIGGEVPVAELLADLARDYADRGVRLEQQGRAWAFRTAPDLAPHMVAVRVQERRLPRAALETLAIIAYRQPVTRPEIDAIRGVDVDAVLTTLLDRRLVRVLGRKDVVGRPLLYGTTPEFLETFGLKDLSSLPRLEELGASADALERAARAAEASAPAANEEAPAASAAPAADAGPEAPAASEEPAADAAPAHAEEE